MHGSFSLRERVRVRENAEALFNLPNPNTTRAGKTGTRDS